MSSLKARESSVFPVVAAQDHTDKEGHFVELNNAGEASLVNAATDLPIGVIVEGAPAGKKSSVALIDGGIEGTIRVKLDAATVANSVKFGTELQLAVGGTVLADTGAGARVVMARATEPGKATELVEAIVFKAQART